MLNAVICDADLYGGERKLCTDISRYGSRGILLDEKNEIAMEFMSQNGCYKLPGGGIELGENETEAFVREIQEEIGCKCEILGQLGTTEEHKSRTNFCQFSFVYYARKTSGFSEVHLTDAEKELGIEIKWMTLEEAARVMAESLEKAEDRKMKFIMMRDKTIVDYFNEQLKSGEITI